MESQNYTDSSDNELLEKFYADRDNKWLGILLPRYTLLLLGVCMKYLKNEHDAQDCVQQIFLKVINELPKYKVEYFKSWIYIIAKNHCLMKLRDKGKYTAEFNETISNLPDETEEKNKLIEKDILINKMMDAIIKLNPEQQQCVSLFYLEKKSYAEIVEITGFSKLQVKSFIQNGKRNLRLMIENN
ncbi:MAG: sigma-70 family RNA polymerase sigma factor [Bacteroidota bacterium]|nr:sigma-70 family RNA polymerase sigma factor [Bacteroidota bacterium]